MSFDGTGVFAEERRVLCRSCSLRFLLAGFPRLPEEAKSSIYSLQDLTVRPRARPCTLAMDDKTGRYSSRLVTTLLLPAHLAVRTRCSVTNRPLGQAALHPRQPIAARKCSEVHKVNKKCALHYSSQGR